MCDVLCVSLIVTWLVSSVPLLLRCHFLPVLLHVGRSPSSIVGRRCGMTTHHQHRELLVIRVLHLISATIPPLLPATTLDTSRTLHLLPPTMSDVSVEISAAAQHYTLDLELPRRQPPDHQSNRHRLILNNLMRFTSLTTSLSCILANSRTIFCSSNAYSHRFYFEVGQNLMLAHLTACPPVAGCVEVSHSYYA